MKTGKRGKNEGEKKGSKIISMKNRKGYIEEC